ncbi:Biuret hydrolase [Pigmentiphaga humi]|uniref:Biuret hydrolase n=1 Tax=Pigmentiphaga humi TaxID=2478468 RepID=A0A3P4B474_9BURK|nr:amidase [Pigmentiphaga humi]VCU71089.1 Biuret hydrolase [Pigmentiphaga humi]
MLIPHTLESLAAALARGTLRSRDLVEDCLARAADPDGEGARAYVRLNPEQARRAADEADRRRRIGSPSEPYAGIPISVKDLFDVEGEVTMAGSVVLRGQAPARADAPSVARLRRAGFIILGRSNMTEFAYSGLGLNPHYGTPRNPYDRRRGRIPGGSSSGAAVSVADDMAAIGLGTDTGGSCRIPAALCGLTGFKPTSARIPLDGVLPLSPSLDSVGTIGRSVDCCAAADAILAGGAVPPIGIAPLAGLRIGVPRTIVLDDLDADVAAAFDRVLRRLGRAGAIVVDAAFGEFAELAAINANGGLPAIESYAMHGAQMQRDGDRYDPRVRARIELGAGQDAGAYRALQDRRADWQRRVGRRMADFNVIAMPTVPTVAPAFDEVAEDGDYTRINLRMLRNPAIVNFLDGCAISLPCHRAGDAPVGFTIAARAGQDLRLFAIARAVESLLRD